MRAVPVSTAIARVPRPVTELAVVLLALADVAINLEQRDPLLVALAALGCVLLPLRRTLPFVTVILTLPLASMQELPVAPLVALVSLGRSTERPWTSLVGLLLYAAAGGLPWPWAPMFRVAGDDDVLLTLAYTLATGAAAVLLGRLLRTRSDLRQRLVDIDEAREHERELYAQNVLSRERAQLAREMHDVVSHQVSLIAVQSAALQVAAREPLAREAAHTIRGLSVTTLDELRTMVPLLRASGTASGELAPQPTLADLEALVSSSDTDARLVDVGALPDDLDSPTQRAVFRTVQEALTNVRKHAPGATVVVQLLREGDQVGVEVRSTGPTRPALSFPASGHGLLGLRERAEALRGTLDSGPTADGGWQVRLLVPRRAS